MRDRQHAGELRLVDGQMRRHHALQLHVVLVVAERRRRLRLYHAQTDAARRQHRRKQRGRSGAQLLAKGATAQDSAAIEREISEASLLSGSRVASDVGQRKARSTTTQLRQSRRSCLCNLSAPTHTHTGLAKCKQTVRRAHWNTSSGPSRATAKPDRGFHSMIPFLPCQIHGHGITLMSRCKRLGIAYELLCCLLLLHSRCFSRFSSIGARLTCDG